MYFIDIIVKMYCFVYLSLYISVRIKRNNNNFKTLFIMNAICLKSDYKNYSNMVSMFEKTYTKKYNLYNTLMYCIKSIKQGNKEKLKEGLKILFTDFEIYIDNLIYIVEYLKLKKCTSFNVYCELLLYFRSFKENRINNTLNFI